MRALCPRTATIWSLTRTKIDLLTAVTDGTFKRVVVVFNTPSSFEATFLKDSAYAAFADKIDAAVWIGFTGSNGITALGEILNGDVNPLAVWWTLGRRTSPRIRPS